MGQSWVRAGVGYLFLQYRLLFVKSGIDGEVVDSVLDFGTLFSYVVFNVKQEGLLFKVGVYNFFGCLQVYGGVEVGLRRRMKRQLGFEGNGVVGFCFVLFSVQIEKALVFVGYCFSFRRVVVRLEEVGLSYILHIFLLEILFFKVYGEKVKEK